MALACYLRADGTTRTRVVLLPPAEAEAAGMAELAAARAIPEAAQWYPPAVHRPLEHDTGGVLSASRGLIEHVQVGDGSPWGWFNRDDVKASSHWWVAKDGRVEQYVPAGRVAWAQVAGNAYWHSVETEGRPHEPLTDAQLDALAALYQWGTVHWGWAPQVTDTPDGRGLGTHEMGGAAWGGHTCPGTVRAEQRAQIIALAQGQPPPRPPEDDVTPDELRTVLDEGTGHGQTTWSGTSRETLAAAQAAVNAGRAAASAADQARRTAADVLAVAGRIAAAVSAEPVGPLTAGQILAGLDEVRSPTDLIAISARASVLAHARLTTPPAVPPPTEASRA